MYLALFAKINHSFENVVNSANTNIDDNVISSFL